MAKIALIPPCKLQYFAWLGQQPMQLVLPELCHYSTAYTKFMWELSQKGQFIMMDNGAFEGKLATYDQIFGYAAAVGAHEIVVPDAMQDADGTIRLMHEFKPWALDHPQFSYAVVLQGKHSTEFKRVAQAAASQSWVSTMCIPKHTFRTTNVHRAIFADWIHERFPDHNVHYLGMDEFARRYERQELLDLHHVRSMDTSLPFVYAMHAQDLMRSEHIINRPIGYFYEDLPLDQEFLKMNVEAVNGD